METLMPDVLMKNFLRFSLFSLASVCSIVGGPHKALSFPEKNLENNHHNNLTSHTANSISTRTTIGSEENFLFETESDSELIASSQFEKVSSSIGNPSDTFSDNTLAGSSSINGSQGYSGNKNPASYYWYRRNKNKNVTPSTVKAAFTRQTSSFSTKFSETLSGLEKSSSTVSETLNNINSPISSSISSGVKPSLSTLGSSQSESNPEPVSGSSLLTSSFSQSF